MNPTMNFENKENEIGIKMKLEKLSKITAAFESLHIMYEKVLNQVFQLNIIEYDFEYYLKKVDKLLNKNEYFIDYEALNEYLERIQNILEQVKIEEPENLQEYVEKFQKRLKLINEVMSDIGKHSLTIIEQYIISEAEKEGLPNSEILKLLKEMRKSLQRTTAIYLVNHEDRLLKRLINQEMSRIKLHYYCSATTIKTLYPDKYNKYLSLIKNCITLYRDEIITLAEKPNNEIPFLLNYFEEVLQKIEQYIGYTTNTSATPQTDTFTCTSNNTTSTNKIQEDPFLPGEYPMHIFSNKFSYLLFLKCMENCTYKDDIAFIYRMMYEKKKNPRILVKQIPFMAWFNALEDKPFELTDKFKTLNNFSKTENRKKKYTNLEKQLREQYATNNTHPTSKRLILPTLSNPQSHGNQAPIQKLKKGA